MANIPIFFLNFSFDWTRKYLVSLKKNEKFYEKFKEI